MESTKGKLSPVDWLKGLIIAVGTPVLMLLQQLIPSWTTWLTGHMGTSGALISQAALSAFVAYILKQLGTDTNKQAVNILEKEKGVTIIDQSHQKQ